ncbi:MAG: hypothetical protein ABH829_01205 [archaeon]
MKCSYAGACELYKQLKDSKNGRLWICNYCEGNCYDCERRKLIEKNHPIPSGMMPNGDVLEKYFDIKVP